MSPEDLGQILSKLHIPTRPDVVHGPEQLDDAGVIRIDDERSLVQTIDFFPPIVDDPRDFGRIAAANALSDVYAMGGEPLSVLNVVGFPRKELDMEILGEILVGGSEKIAESGAALLGGHSVQDGEIKYGLSVTGVVRTDSVWSNSGARVGDVLVLTKPLGMGAVTTSIQKGTEDADQVAAAVESMATLNASGARAIAGLDVKATTDVTGFGLLGHGAEIARGSNVTLRFDSSALPFTPGAEELAAAGCLSGGAARSRRFLGDHAVVGSGVSEAHAALGFDAETSGGLLIAINPNDLDTLLGRLKEAKTPACAVVGEVIAAEGETWVRLD